MERTFRRLANKASRRAYVRAELVNGVASQIRILRQERNWTQVQLAKRLKTTQTVVSRLEDPSYGKFSIQTLLQVGDAFDVALHVRYMPFSEFMLRTWDTSPHRFSAASYDEERHQIGFYSLPSGPYLHSIGSLSGVSTGQVPLASVTTISQASPASLPISAISAAETIVLSVIQPNHKASNP
ncbi:MAG: helix-turn-helix transcriptional regulator [Pseudomonadota bacterium]